MMDIIKPAIFQEAQAAMQHVVHHTPLQKSTTFSSIAGCEVYLKLESLQKTGSFKIRGAYNKIRTLTQEEKDKGVIAASAGNHAQGVAYAARMSNVNATIVMPEAAPLSKVMATRGYGAEVVLSGAGYDEAYHQAQQIQAQFEQTFIHAFNDERVITGQGTIGLEILEDLEDVSAIVVPVGGGGLIAGVAAAVKELAPHVSVYGVQAQGAPAAYMSKQAHCLKTVAGAMTIADGIAVKSPGDLTFAFMEKYVDDIVVVDDETIANTILMLLERSKLMVEGAGAISLAAVLNGKITAKGKVVSVISGGNIDVNFISRIIERGLVRAGRRIVISTSVNDRPGALQQLLNHIAICQANVVSVYHDRIARNVPLGQSVVEITLDTRDIQHTQEIIAALKEKGYTAKLV